MTPDTEGLRRALVEAIAVMPAGEAGLVLADVAQAVMDRRSPLGPTPVLLLVTTGRGLAVVIGSGAVAPTLATAHDAIKQALVAGGRT